MTDRPAPEPAPTSVSKLPLLIMGVVVVMAVVVIFVALVASGPKSYRAGSAEAALQDFISAGLDDDDDLMLSLLTPAARARCEDELGAQLSGRYRYGQDLRAELSSLDIDDDRADASVKFRPSNRNDPFESSSWSYNERFELHHIDGSWLVDRAGWPGQLAQCSRKVP